MILILKCCLEFFWKFICFGPLHNSKCHGCLLARGHFCLWWRTPSSQYMNYPERSRLTRWHPKYQNIKTWIRWTWTPWLAITPSAKDEKLMFSPTTTLGTWCSRGSPGTSSPFDFIKQGGPSAHDTGGERWDQGQLLPVPASPSIPCHHHHEFMRSSWSSWWSWWQWWFHVSW